MSELGREFNAYQSFVLGVKLYWTRQMYPRLRESYVGMQPAEDKILTSHKDVRRRFENNIDYASYAWFERHLQRMKYSGHRGLIPAHEPRRAELESWLDQPLPAGLLTLAENFEPPRHFTAVDIHQHPGGVCGDTLAGIVYERGARTTTPLLDKDLDLHHRFTRVIASHSNPRQIADLGCGFGKSTQPLYENFSNAQVTGIDLSAPCLKLAARMAADSNAGNVRFKQATVENNGLPSGAFDLVTSTMLLHEMPPSAVQTTIAQSHRLLERGGVAIHLDFLADADPFNRFIHYGHARRNNEPYMAPLNEMDLIAAHETAGFSDVEVVAFEEFPGALDNRNHNWRFPWAVIIARKS